MEVKLAALADFASLTREGKLNILGVFDRLRPPMLPFVLPMMHLVVVFDSSPAEPETEKSVNIILMGADGQKLFAVENTMRVGPVKYPGIRPSSNLIVALAGVQFTNPGDYQFSVLVNGEEKKALRLIVDAPPQPNSEGSSDA